MTRVRSARTGRFAPKGDAAAKPSETVTEGRRRGYQPSKAVLRALSAYRSAYRRWFRAAPGERWHELQACRDAATFVNTLLERECHAEDKKRKARRKAGR